MIIAILGPTASGKSALALELARHFDTEIINADSVQIYRRLDIGSAKPTLAQRREVTHHMIDIVDPEEDYSVALYQKETRACIADMLERGKRPLLVGGTAYYVKSVLHDYRFGGLEGKAALIERHKDTDNETLHALLSQADAKTASKIHPNNRKRVLQALHRALQGTPVSSLEGSEKTLYDYHLVGLDIDRSVLEKRIVRRVEEMFEKGLLEEVKRLHEEGIRAKSVEAIGYRELYAHLDGACTLAEAKASIERNTLRYVKKQMTFFRKMDIDWISVDVDDFDTTVRTVIARIEARSA